MMIYKLSTGDEVHRYDKSIVIPFKGERKVVSSGPLNGGYREDLKYVFNNDSNPGAGIACTMKGETYEEHMMITATELGLDGEFASGLCTAASMDNVSIKEEEFEDVKVTAIVTGGIDVNGGRAGDPASYVERNKKISKLKLGTINIILVIDADLAEGTMVRSVVTATEAKTAAITELMAGSMYSRGLATGSGTDGIIVVSNPSSDNKLTDAGKHSKLGELIGLSVKSAVKEALFLQTELSPKYQHSFLKRMKRFKVDEDILWEKYKNICIHKKAQLDLTKAEFINSVHKIERNNRLVTLTSLYAHLIDELDWELLSKEEVSLECINILNEICSNFDLESPLSGHAKLNIKNEDSKDQVISKLIDKFMLIITLIAGVKRDV